MALQHTAVGKAPVDIAAQFSLDGSRIAIENLGTRPLRFAPAEAAGEAAPADLRGGFLLEPGERETLRPAGGAGFPLWVWGDGEVGVGPAIGPETGGGGRTLGPATNTFGDDTTADKAAAAVLRDAYAAANAAWLAQYADRNLLILLRWTGDGEVVQRRNVAGDAWEDVTDVIRGPAGTDGANGAAGPGAIVTTSATYSAADDEIDLGLAADPGVPAVIFWRVPADVDRKNAALSIITGSFDCPLKDPAGAAVVARRLSPGFLLASVYFAGECHLAEVLPPRPQDYRAVFVVGEDANDDDLVAADMATARAAVSPEDGGLIDVAAAFAAAGVSSATHRRYYWLGVPADAPDPSRLWIDGQARKTDRFGSLEAFAGGPDYGGGSYKWWRSANASGFVGSQRVRFLFEQGAY